MEESVPEKIPESLTEETDTDQYKPCPKCRERDPDNPPNNRAQSSGGKWYGYCRVCLNQYHKDRQRAATILTTVDPVTRTSPTHSFSSIQWAIEILTTTNKTLGRPSTQNQCPKCGIGEREPWGSYCRPCRIAYQKDRREQKRLQVQRILASQTGAAEEEQTFITQIATKGLGPPSQSNFDTTSSSNPFDYIDPEDLQALQDSVRPESSQRRAKRDGK